MKGKISFLIFLAVFVAAQLAMANSVTYRVSATIPAIVGVNVFPEKELADDTAAQAQASLEKQVIEVVRNNERVLLETFTAK